jgi:predicted glycoside hydrolase/deacetylase ChbG (UPF0249 family)
LNKKLIVNADDFGRTASITHGILRAHQAGIVTSCTAMMNVPASGEALREAATACPELGIGVHLNITHGRPLMPARQVPSLVDDGDEFRHFNRNESLIASINPDELRAEWGAQVDKMISLGIRPDHLDSHHHLAYLDISLFTVLLDVAAAFRLPIRFPPQEYHHALGGGDIRRMLTERGISAPLSCQTEFFGAGASRNKLLDIIRALPEGTHELMCHPGLPDSQLRATSAYGAEREQELAVLTHRAVKAALVRHGVGLARFADL